MHLVSGSWLLPSHSTAGSVSYIAKVLVLQSLWDEATNFVPFYLEIQSPMVNIDIEGCEICRAKAKVFRSLHQNRTSTSHVGSLLNLVAVALARLVS